MIAMQMCMLSLHGLISLLNAPTRKFNFRPVHTPNIPTGSQLYLLLPPSLHLPDCRFHYENRQTVFYTPTTMTVSEGQQIHGLISCAPNAKNNRDLDIAISYQTGEDPETRIQYKMCVLLSVCSRSLSFAFFYLNER